MAFALHNILLEQCNGVEFSQCDVLQTGTWGPDLLRAIREVSFTGMQGTQVSIFFLSLSRIHQQSNTNDMIL